MSNFQTDLILYIILTSVDRHQGYTLVQELHMLCVLASLHALSSESTTLGNNVASMTAEQ
jgi:hypothetical protein